MQETASENVGADARRRLAVYAEHVDVATCRACGDGCCKASPGTPAPEDFGAPDEDVLVRELYEALISREWEPDCFERPFVLHDGSRLEIPGLPDGVLFLVRPSTKSTGSCVFWKAKVGCSIFERRPAGCRILRPELSEKGRPLCELGADDVRAIVTSWGRFQDCVRAAILAAGAAGCTWRGMREDDGGTGR